ncbi:FKBP-type peptidyl-prolyl cis-trans isomerase [Planctomycetota bacterium]|nr:FKBP-type peptidyl-prolyl cis-trans isomerase [Planctomycetota bacterium]
MPIIVNSPFSGKPVKVRDEDVGRAIRDEENRIFYVIQRASGEGFYGAPTRKGSEKDEQRYDDLLDKVNRGEAFAKQQQQTTTMQVHDARGKKRKLSPVRVIAFLLLLGVLAFIAWYYVGGGEKMIQDFIDQQKPVEVEEVIIETPGQPPSEIDIKIEDGAADQTNLPPVEDSNTGNEPVSKGGMSSRLIETAEYVILAAPSKESIATVSAKAETDSDSNAEASSEAESKSKSDEKTESPPDDGDHDGDVKQNTSEGEEAAENAAFVVLPSGVKYWIDVEGEKEAKVAKAGDWVVVEYKAWLPGGVPVSSSTKYGPMEFVLWSGQALRGWDEAISGMKVGERRTLILPPELIENDSLMTRDENKKIENTLVSEVHLVDVKPGIGVKILKGGTGKMTRPGDIVSLDYEGKVRGAEEPFISKASAPGGKPLVFEIGKGQVIPGLELAATGMTVGEEREVLIPSYLAYGEKGFAPLIPKNAPLVYRIKLEKIERPEQKQEQKGPMKRGGGKLKKRVR